MLTAGGLVHANSGNRGALRHAGRLRGVARRGDCSPAGVTGYPMNAETQKNEGLQAARAIAALSVAYFHSYMIFNGWPNATVFPIPFLKEHGYLGVNFFFVISGYVIAKICDKPDFSVREFVTKRFFRLYPVYWIIVIEAVALKFCGVIIPTSYKWAPVIYSMTLLPHTDNAQPFLPVTWSLEFEIMFYFLAVLIVPLFRVWGLAIVLFGLVYWAYVAPPDFFTFHLVRTLNADFLAGVLAYLFRKPLSYLPPLILIPVGLFGYYSAVVLFILPFSASIGGLLLVTGLANAKLSWDRWPLRWLVKVGDASYSLYLLHFLVIWIFVNLTQRIGGLPAWTAEPMRFAYLGICVWLALLSYRLIERPIIDYGNRLARWAPSPRVKEAPAN
jgi:exopolysaccharide production protein ExoZ